MLAVRGQRFTASFRLPVPVQTKPFVAGHPVTLAPKITAHPSRHVNNKHFPNESNQQTERRGTGRPGQQEWRDAPVNSILEWFGGHQS